METLLAVDLGATNLRAALARVGTVRTASDGDDPVQPDLLARIDRSTPQGPTGEAVTDALRTVAREVCEAAGVDPAGVVAAGVGSIGPVDAAAGAVVDPPNVPVDRIPVAESLASALDLPTSRVAFHNDCTAGVLGERAFGGAPANAVYLTLSTGIGAGACVDGTVLSGHCGNAAEMGHVVVDPAGRLDCGCGAAGHWEAYCSGTGIPRLAAFLAETEGVETSLALGDPDAPSIDAATVFAADDGDPLAARTLEEVARLNAVGFAATVHAFAPETVRVGGAVARSNPETVLGPLRERLPAHLAVETPAIEAASFGGDAVLFGALAAACEVA